MSENRQLALASSVLVLCMAVLGWAASRIEAPGAPEVAATATADETGARLCERKVTGALARYGFVWTKQGDTAQQLGAEATQLTTAEYQIMTEVLPRFESAMASTGGPYIVDDIQAVIAEVRTACDQAL